MPIHLIQGPMYAGKTSSLVQKGRECLAHNRVLFVRHTFDTRPNLTHNGSDKAKSFCHDLVVKQFLKDVDTSQAEVVLVDEGQFFEDLNECAQRWSLAGKDVYVAALAHTATRQIWPSVSALEADTVCTLCAVCVSCSGKAEFTRKKTDDGLIIDVGGVDKYEPVCEECF